MCKVTNCCNVCTHASAEPSQYKEKIHLITKTAIYTKDKYTSVVIRRRGVVENTVYWHHAVLGV